MTPIMNRIRDIEDAVCEGLKRGGLEIVHKDGDRFARVYDYSQPSARGGWEIVAEISVYRIARDIERALS